MSITVSELKAFLNMVNGEDVVYMLTPEMDEGVVLLQYSDDE